MKYTNKILEAIQKGINLAVDDFGSLDTIEVQKKARIKNDIHMKDLLPWVDLGLSSGTLWYKYNVGVDPDKLEKVVDWYGEYYTFDEANALKNYKMPTAKQIQELINETESKWIENYNNIEGLNGRDFVGTNGNSIFIPAAGYHSRSSLDRTGAYCYCWSSGLCLSDPQDGYNLSFNSSYIFLLDEGTYHGFSARPVLNR